MEFPTCGWYCAGAGAVSPSAVGGKAAAGPCGEAIVSSGWSERYFRSALKPCQPPHRAVKPDTSAFELLGKVQTVVLVEFIH